LSTAFSADNGYDIDPDALSAEEDRLADAALDAEAETIAAGADPLHLGDQVEEAATRRVRCACGRLRRVWEDCGHCREAYLHAHVHGAGFVGDLNVFTPPMADRRVAGRRAA
jgi:hypothetical protein